MEQLKSKVFIPVESDTHNLTRSRAVTEDLITNYSKLQTQPWGQSSVVLGFYFISNIEFVDSGIPNRQQALATAYWKQQPEDYFNTDVKFQFLMGALFNKRSTHPDISMADLPGETIEILQLDVFGSGEKTSYAIHWKIADEIILPPDDVLYDIFYRETEEDQLIADDDNINHFNKYHALAIADAERRIDK